jgi:hypothetical protein
MQKTERQRANVMAVSLHLVGYSKSSSSSPLFSGETLFLACSLSRELLGPGVVSRTEGASEGSTLASLVSKSPTLRVAVFSESARLRGRRDWLCASAMGGSGSGGGVEEWRCCWGMWARAEARVGVRLRGLAVGEGAKRQTKRGLRKGWRINKPAMASRTSRRGRTRKNGIKPNGNSNGNGKAQATASRRAAAFV